MKTSEVRTRVAWLLIATVMVVAPPVRAQTPWTVTVTPTMNPLPVGFCAAVQISIRDAAGTDVPRSPQGYRITLADFDMAVAAPNATSVVGQQIDATHWSVCACQGAAPGTDATITATYPARALPESSRVKGASFQSTSAFVLAPPKGTGNPPACETLASKAASSTPVVASAPARITIGAMPVAPPMTVAPAPAPTRSNPVGQVSPKGVIGERIAPYKPGPVTVAVDLSANGWWFEPSPITVDIEVDAHGFWYVPTPVTVAVDLSATGNWIELVKSPIAPREPARQ
jgi:hypothetical protein